MIRGCLQRWDIERIIHDETRGKADAYEVSSLRGKLDSLECSVREISSDNSRLRAELQEVQENFRQLIERIEAPQ